MKNAFGDNRTANILTAFSKSPSLSLSVLAERLGVSERTVRNDIRQLNEAFRGCAAIEIEQGRCALHIYDKEAFASVKARLLDADEYLNSPRNRMDHIFGRLLRSAEPLLTDELAYEMSASRNTVLIDLKKLRAELEPYRLSIIGVTGKGIELQGEETDIRHYILENNYDALYRRYPMEPEIDFIVDSAFAESPFEKKTQALFRKFLTVMLDRCLTDHAIPALAPAFYNLTTRSEFILVDGLLRRIEDFLGVSLPAEERLFVLLPIIGMRTPADVQNMQSIELDSAMVELGEKVFEQIRQELDIRIERPEAIEEFLYHLMFMLNRLRFNVRLKSPITDELREKYPLAWRMADIAARVIRREYGLEVTADERSYLATYFGVFLEERERKKSRAFRAAVVSGPGRITGRLVQAQLRKVLDSSVEMALVAEDVVTAETLSDYDIVFTTVPLSCETKRPVIQIHEVFNEQELRHKVEKIRYFDQVDVPVLDSNWFVMVGLLDENRFFVLDNSESYESSLHGMVQSLTEQGLVDEGFWQRLSEREHKQTMVYDHAVAIPHTVQSASNRLVLSIGVFREPVSYQGREVRVVFLMGIPEQIGSDDGLLIRVYEEIISVTQDTPLLDRLSRADSFQTLLRVLYRQAR